MKTTLAQWVGDADAIRHFKYFGVASEGLITNSIQGREDDYYISLVGELFERLRDDYAARSEWAHLGNALSQFILDKSEEVLASLGINRNEGLLLASSAYFFGGYPASAYITIREGKGWPEKGLERTCFELLSKPKEVTSVLVRDLVSYLKSGDENLLNRVLDFLTEREEAFKNVGPKEWASARLAKKLAYRFEKSNLRSVLPNGKDDFWDDLIELMIKQNPPVWDLFPSQIEAIHAGLLDTNQTFSLQMPTGAGKTSLCEIAIFHHLNTNRDSAALFLVPYRSLASELRKTLVKRMNSLGLAARCAYGGTIPSGDEVRSLEETRVLVATPESVSGLLSTDSTFFSKISLVICDEGHLLDGGARGIGLELLLARLKSQTDVIRKFVFISAIVPNIEEINAWLGGSEKSVVRSDYRPAIAEYSMLRTTKSGKNTSISLVMHPHEAPPLSYAIDGFLNGRDFSFLNPKTRRVNTYKFTTNKTMAIAAARKCLVMGTVAVFAANKGGGQGAIGLAEELVEQIQANLPLPAPLDFVTGNSIVSVLQYFELEYGKYWVGTQALSHGAVLHHGDIPQETREIVEAIIREKKVRLVICTSTLAEGVNLPIRSLVLYSVQRRSRDRNSQFLLSRDIKNLVGRAGRAGSTTKGLVVCVNEDHWPQVERVARQLPGESVHGELRKFISELRNYLVFKGYSLNNYILENDPHFSSLVDGIDSTLVDLAATEIGIDELRSIAIDLADQTYASSQMGETFRRTLQDVFSLRAERIIGIRTTGRLGWVTETGARARMIDLVEKKLLPLRDDWDGYFEPADSALLCTLIDWVWMQEEFLESVRSGFRLAEESDVSLYKESYIGIVSGWIAGKRHVELASDASLDINEILLIINSSVSYVFQSLVEQGIAILVRILEADGYNLALHLKEFPSYLRFGVPSNAGRLLASFGLRHRIACVALGLDEEIQELIEFDKVEAVEKIEQILTGNPTFWMGRLGLLVYRNTLSDLRTSR